MRALFFVGALHWIKLTGNLAPNIDSSGIYAMKHLAFLRPYQTPLTTAV